MLGTPELYKLYKELQKLKVIHEINKVNELRKEKEIILNHYKTYVGDYSRFKDKEYYLLYNTTEMPKFPVKEEVELMNVFLKQTKECFEIIVDLNLKIQEYTTIIEKHHNNKITLKIYSDVIRGFSQQMIEQIVKGYVLRMGCIGDIRVVRKQRKGKNINWGDSMKLKQQLIDDGVKILKFGIDDDDKVINNGGEPYLLYWTSEEAYWLIWDRTRQSFFNKEEYPLFPYYNLLFTKGEDDKGSIMRLVRTWQQDKYVHLRYAKR